VFDILNGYKPENGTMARLTIEQALNLPFASKIS